MDTGVKERPSLKMPSTVRRTAIVAAVISGPMPSPSITAMRTGADCGVGSGVIVSSLGESLASPWLVDDRARG